MEAALLRSRLIQRPLLAAAFLSTTLLIGTTGGDPVPGFQVAGAVIGAAFVIAWMRSIRRWSDRVDLLTTVALVLFATSALFAVFPRQAFDAAVQALVWVATFGVARRAVSDEGSRHFILVVMACIGALLAVAFLVLWGSIWLRWLGLTSWQSIPPLDLPLPSSAWAHQHDLTTLLVVLAPAIWLQRGTGIRRVIALAIIGCVGAVVVMDGSRSVWLALGVAGLVVAAGPTWRLLHNRRILLASIAGIAALAVVALALGAGEELLRRVTNVHTLSARANQWGPALGFVADRPIQGSGPGSFPFLLRLTDYFTTSEYVSRHPDNALVQLVVEGGLLGLAAAALVVTAVVRGWRKGSHESRAAALALVFATAVGIGTNPFEYAFLIAPILAWAAIGTPAAAPEDQRTRAERSPRWVAAASAGLAALAGVAVVATLAASVLYDVGAGATQAGDLHRARDAFELAAELDPSMALYRRELGVAELEVGNWDESVAELRAAAAMNPADDVARRALAEAHLRLGDLPGALSAAEKAVELDATDIANLGMLARVANMAHDPDIANDVLTKTLLHAPYLAADPAWFELVGYRPDVPSLSNEAVTAWRAGEAPWLKGLRPAWLVALAGEPRDSGAAREAAQDRPVMAPAINDLMHCEAQAEALRSMREEEQSSRADPEYWFPRLLAEEIVEGRITDRLASLATLVHPTWQAVINDDLRPRDFFSGGRRDQYGYHRAPVLHPVWYPVPSTWSAVASWLENPDAAGGVYAVGCAGQADD